MGICKVKSEHSNVQKMCKFFVVPGNGQATLGMPDIDTLDIMTHRNDSANNCSTNTAICQSSRHVKHYKNMMQDADRAEKCYANTDSIS